MIDKLTRAASSATQHSISSRTMPVLSSLPVIRAERRAQDTSAARGAPRYIAAANPLPQQAPNPQLLDARTLLPPQPDTLLLEGDEFYISSDGISRTYYKLKSWSTNGNGDEQHSITPVSLEEQYNLKRASKTFIVRRDDSCNISSSLPNVARLGSPLSKFELQEIDQGVLGSAGTGATTWESSIAMSLYFSSNPNLLLGNVVELGSGVGLAGLLSQMAPTALSKMQSLTLTDGSNEVLEQCRRNLNQIEQSGLPIHVQNLNWHDFVDGHNTAGKPANRYDTVLASDCAYRYSDVAALAATMTALCRKNETSRIHIFSPYNRGALHKLVQHLKDDCGLQVEIDWIEMSRFRLKPRQDMRVHHENECSIASSNTAKFLHITAWHQDSISRGDGKGNDCLSDID